MANANGPQILPYTQELRGKNRSLQWSSRGQKLYKKLFCAAPWLTALPRPPSWWEGGSQAAPLQEPHPPPPFGPRSPFALSWKKILVVTWATSVPILVFLGLSILDLCPMYATDRQTSDRRQTSDTHHRLMHPCYGGGGIIILRTIFIVLSL